MTQEDKSMVAEKTGRRQFLNRLWSFLGLAAVVEFTLLGGVFLNSRKERNKPERINHIVTAGPTTRFAPASVTAIPQGQFYLACLADGSFLALSRTCTHLGCSVPWDEEKNRFACPCHGSTFSMTGEVLTAPAPRPLDTYPVRIENGILKVDISVVQRRERFEPSQTIKI